MSKSRRTNKATITVSVEQTELLRGPSEELLRSLDVVATAALNALQVRPSGDPTGVLVTDDNPMTAGQLVGNRLATVRNTQRGHVQRVASEPFVCRVAVTADDGRRETIHVTRGSATAVAVPGIKLATYTSPLGRVAELDVGDFHSYVVRGETRELRVVERVTLTPEFRDRWDGTDVEFSLEGLQAEVDSLRRLLDAAKRTGEEDDFFAQLEAEEAARQAGLERQRRRVRQHMALRDQPTLDKLQGNIFRMPLDRQVFLHGPPGSGKTTTLIRRLAQKRNAETLTEEEIDLLDQTGMRETFERPSNWVMFSPTNLLQLYLRDAFAREQVPADTNHNLRTWEKTRRDLARNVLGILRAADETRGFELDDAAILRDADSPALARLHDQLLAQAESSVTGRVERALADLKKAPDDVVRGAVERLIERLRGGKGVSFREVSALIEEAAPLQSEVTRLRRDTDAAIERISKQLLTQNQRALLEEMVAALPALQGDRDDDDGDDDEEDDDEDGAPQRSPQLVAARLLQRAMRSHARSVAEKRKASARAQRVFALLGSRAPSDAQLGDIGRGLLMIRNLNAVIRAPRNLLTRMPQHYARLRRSEVATLVREDATGKLRQNKLSDVEVDVIILAMLTVARRYFEQERRRLRGDVPAWLAGIRERYVGQVFVDEATDFSGVQLAAMLELSHPTLRSWFASGDFKQRITAHGVKAPEELEWVARTAGLHDRIDVREVQTGYRQTRRLEQLGAALSALPLPQPRDAEEPDPDEPWPLLRENAVGPDLASWIAARLAEVEKASNQLPSVAVFVDREDRIDPLVDSLRPVLHKLNISVRACRDGNDIGDQQEVRVFDIRHIKGLEFEAVFFIGADRLAESIPDLFERFLFVGTTRAATFLAVTCEASLPPALEPLRAQFSNGNWTR